MKKCFKCGEEKPLSDFYTHPRMGDGHLNKCKFCTRKDATKHRNGNIERIMAYDRERAKRPEAIGQRREANRRHRAAYPKEVSARRIAYRAVRSGLIAKPSRCQDCGATGRIEAHHADYDQPMRVDWLCPRCHKQAHGRLTHVLALNFSK